MNKEEIEKVKIGLWNIRAENLRAMQCSLANTEDKIKWLKEIDTIDSVLNYIEQLETEKQVVINKLKTDIELFKLESEYPSDHYEALAKIEYANKILEMLGEKK